jgi:hypothetical protein
LEPVGIGKLAAQHSNQWEGSRKQPVPLEDDDYCSCLIEGVAFFALVVCILLAVKI